MGIFLFFEIISIGNRMILSAIRDYPSRENISKANVCSL